MEGENKLASWVIRFLLIYGLLSDVSCQETSTMKGMKAVKDRIFKDYDKLIRPLVKDRNSTYVSFGIHPRYIIELDEDRSLFKMDTYFIMHWLDPRLSWNKTEFDSSYIQLPISMLWKPDLSLYNSHSAEVDPYQEVLAVVNNTGGVFWVPPATTETFCAPESDEVTCDLVIGSWAHDGWEMDLHLYNKDIFMDEFFNTNPRWKLKEDEVSIHRKVEIFECCEEPYISIHILFPLVRLPAPQIWVVRTPCVLVSVLLMALLWVPPQEYLARVLLGSALFLALILLMAYAAASASTARVAKHAVSLLLPTTYVTTFVLVLQVLTLRLGRMRGPSRPNPTLVRWLSGPLSRYACLSNRTPVGDRVQLKEEEEPDPTVQEEWQLVAAALDRLVFVAALLTMTILQFVD